MFDQSVREIHEMLPCDLTNPPLRHPANPPIRPQFLLAAKPQTYKGGSRAGGSESAAHGFDTAMRAAIPRPPSSTILPHPFQSSVACLELLFLPQRFSLYVRVCIYIYIYIHVHILRNMYTRNVHVYTRGHDCTVMYVGVAIPDSPYLAHGRKVFPATFVPSWSARCSTLSPAMRKNTAREPVDELPKHQTSNDAGHARRRINENVFSQARPGRAFICPSGCKLSDRKFRRWHGGSIFAEGFILFCAALLLSVRD